MSKYKYKSLNKYRNGPQNVRFFGFVIGFRFV